MTDSTIYALASGKGRAGVALIRISGPAAGTTYQALVRKDLPEPRRATYVCLRHPSSGALLDDGLAIWFRGPASYTGEDVVELQIHGGLAVISAVMDCLSAQSDLRLAEPGEFTRRAFLNGKMDLTEAEGLIDLIDAETEAQRKQAQRQSQGALGRLYADWSTRLVSLLAYYEAEIDFADEELPDQLGQRNENKIREILNELKQHLDDNRRGERLRDGVRVAIIGPPNAGKSSLLNLLAQRDVAIVSDIAGTTRDVIEVHLDLNGYPVILCDTAGIREVAGDAIENEGMRRALKLAEESDIKVVVVDATRENWESELTRYKSKKTLSIVNKTDLLPSFSVQSGVHALSVRTGAGVQEFLTYLGEIVADEFGLTETPVLTRKRHREAVQNGIDSLARMLEASELALATEDLRMAVRSLGRLTGQVDVEDLLDIIFSEFCIGK